MRMMPESMSCVSTRAASISSLSFAVAENLDVAVRYGFKEDPNTKELPEYGQAMLDRDNNYW